MILPPTTVPESAAITACALLIPLLDTLAAKGVLDKDDVANILSIAQTGIGPHLAKPNCQGAADLIAYVSRSVRS